MFEFLKNIRHSLVSKFILAVGLILLVSISVWAYFNIKYQNEKSKIDLALGAERLSNTIKLGTHYAMMLNSRDEINQIINNIAKQKDIENIRIYNKEGQIKFSNLPDEVNRQTNIKAEACDICHRNEPPLTELELKERTRMSNAYSGYRVLSIISPIYNEPGCSTSSCHFHPSEKKILGALDVTVSLEESDKRIGVFEKGIILLAVFVFIITGHMIFFLMLKFVKQPINKLIDGTRSISKGDYQVQIDIDPKNELGQLGWAINEMGNEIEKKQSELNRQKDIYQTLFETVPCIITVQDQDYKLVQYNREFADRFAPSPGEYCYRVYKGREEKCVICPVENTFMDGRSHQSEEHGVSKDGSPQSWLVRTSPIKDDDGNIVAVMEMNLDITQRKLLEDKLEKSEKKYHDIFNNIPNPVFVLDKDNLKILDFNDSVSTVYGFDKEEMRERSFLEMFPEQARSHMESELKSVLVINQVKQIKKEGSLFVNIRISPSDYPGQDVLLVTTSDITKRLEAEQQLIQASKMATLGEMATGVAHELNQPLSVIKTASNFFMRKITKKEKISDKILLTMSEEIDSHVDRASKIINHMRQFGRKSDLNLEEVNINSILEKTFEVFSQQLTVRGIEVLWDLGENLPPILADPDRLEQVFINLLINARDAIMDRLASEGTEKPEKVISLHTKFEKKEVVARVCDSGIGVPPGILDKIFEPFFTTKDVGKGTGLGLSISYGIIKDIGGNILAAGNKPNGTCFIITIPAYMG